MGCLIHIGAAMGYGGEFGQPSVTPLRDPFSFVCSPDRPSSRRRRLHPTTSARTFLDHPTQRSCDHISLESLSSGNWRQRAREHLPGCPSSVRSSRCHGWRPLPIALREQSATSLSWLHERQAQGVVRTHKMVVCAPPFQIGQKLWGLLSRRPGTACESGHPMTDRQIHPFNKSRVHPVLAT